MPRLKPGVAAFAAFRVQGRPAPKGSRDYMGKGRSKPASRFEKGWVGAVSLAAQQHRLRYQDGQTRPAPYQVTLRFLIESGATAKYDWPSQCDLDKLARSTIDGLVLGRLILDDRHVTRLTATKQFGETPGCVISIHSP